MNRALNGFVPSEVEAADQAARSAPSRRFMTQMTRAGIGFCIFAIAIVLFDTIFLRWRNAGAPSITSLSAAGFGWLLLAWPTALKTQLEDTLALERWSAMAAFSAFLALYAVTRFDPTPYNEQVRQAFALLHGHTYIDAPKSFLEAAQIGPYRYALHPPLPALLLMPWVLVYGMDIDQTTWSLFIGAIDVALMWRLLGRFRLTVDSRVWLTAFFGAGTVLWYETIMGHTWALPETVSILFTLLALHEAFGRARTLWLGIWAGLAALARYELAIAGFTYAILALMRGRRVRDILWMIPGFAAVGAFFVPFNYARFGSFFDQGVMITGPAGAPVFSVNYLLGNIQTVFFLEPRMIDTFPYFQPTFAGQAITYTSPAFVLALRSSLLRLEPLLMAVTALIVSIPSLLCYANGFAQFGTRHYLQVFPFLIVMMAMGMRRADRLAKVLIVTSIIFIAYGIWYIKLWGLNA